MQNTTAAPAALRLDHGISCEVIRTPFALTSFEEEYRTLLAKSSRATLYQSWEWIHSWWLTFRSPQIRLSVMAFREGSELIGCAPLIVRRPGQLPLRRLEPIGVLRSDYLDLVFADGREQDVLEAFYEQLAHATDWDLLDLQQLPEESPTLAYFRGREAHLHCYVRQQEVCPYVPLPETWDAFLASLGKKNRYNVGYYRRLLERDFRVWIGRVDRDDFDSSMEHLFRLHQLRWRKRRLPGAFFSAGVRDFHRRAASALLDRRMLNLYRLDLNGQPAAMLYCFAQNGRGYYYLGGFDPAYSRYSTGTVLTAFAIQQSIAQGHTVFDFLRGDEPYKYRWNVQEKHTFRVEWLRGGPRSRALYRLNEGTRAVEHQAKRLARKMEK